MTLYAQLTQFNPALVYGFQTEASRLDKVSGNASLHAIHIGAQYEDVYLAYLYAQNEVLPTINNIQAVTPGQLLSWIKQCHSKMGAALAKESGTEAGRYVNENEHVIRWHAGLNIQEPIVAYLSMIKLDDPDQEVQEVQDVIDYIANKFEISADDLGKFLAVAGKYHTDIKPGTTRDPYAVGKQTMMNLIVAHTKNELSEVDKKIVIKIVTITMPPEKVPEAMRLFAEKAVEGWKKCDPQNIDVLARFLAETFYELTETHPFSNGNGRTATWLINVMLVSLGLPSILLRNPNEKNDPTSSYSIAIASLNDENIAPLTEHIKQRIIMAKNGQQGENKALADIVELRIKIKDMYILFMEKYVQFDLGAHREDIRKNKLKVYDVKPDDYETIKMVLETELASLIKKKDELLLLSTNEGKITLKNALEKISGLGGWGISTKDGIKLWAQAPEDKLHEAIEKLGKIDGIKIEKRKLSQQPDAGKAAYLALISEINPDALMQYAKALPEKPIDSNTNTNALKHT
ncbi:MAG: Fic family protein [Gammaproteobacteria bacterium]